MPRKLSPAGYDLIKSFEGCKLHAYLDSVNVPTIGWGRTKGVRLGDTITQERADAWLVEEIDTEYGPAVESAVTVPLNDNQFAALVSFTYNLGSGNLRRSTLLRKLNAGDYVGASKEFAKWNKAGAKVLKGLTRRRAAEAALFLKEDDGDQSE